MIYIYIMRSYNRGFCIIRIPSNGWRVSNVDCRDDVGGRQAVIISKEDIHYSLNIPQSPCSFDQLIPGLSQLRYFLFVLVLNMRSFSYDTWFWQFLMLLSCSNAPGFSNPKSFGNAQIFLGNRIHTQSPFDPRGLPVGKIARHIGKNSLMVPWRWNSKTWSFKIFRNKQAKDHTNLCCLKASFNY